MLNCRTQYRMNIFTTPNPHPIPNPSHKTSSTINTNPGRPGAFLLLFFLLYSCVLYMIIRKVHTPDIIRLHIIYCYGMLQVQSFPNNIQTSQSFSDFLLLKFSYFCFLTFVSPVFPLWHRKHSEVASLSVVTSHNVCDYMIHVSIIHHHHHHHLSSI